MYWTNESLLFGIEGELRQICMMTMRTDGTAYWPSERSVLYALCMGMIRISAMIDRLSPEFMGEYPNIHWEQVRAIGQRYALYPLTMDAEEMLELADEELPDFFDQILSIIEDMQDTLPY